jgi:hypothetical protein
LPDPETEAQPARKAFDTSFCHAALSLFAHVETVYMLLNDLVIIQEKKG